MAKLTVAEIEAVYGITSLEIKNALNHGQIEGERNHGNWVITEQSLMRAIDAGHLKHRKKSTPAT